MSRSAIVVPHLFELRSGICQYQVLVQYVITVNKIHASYSFEDLKYNYKC